MLMVWRNNRLLNSEVSFSCSLSIIEIVIFVYLLEGQQGLHQCSTLWTYGCLQLYKIHCFVRSFIQQMKSKTSRYVIWAYEVELLLVHIVTVVYVQKAWPITSCMPIISYNFLGKLISIWCFFIVPDKDQQHNSSVIYIGHRIYGYYMKSRSDGLEFYRMYVASVKVASIFTGSRAFAMYPKQIGTKNSIICSLVTYSFNIQRFCKVHMWSIDIWVEDNSGWEKYIQLELKTHLSIGVEVSIIWKHLLFSQLLEELELSLYIELLFVVGLLLEIVLQEWKFRILFYMKFNFSSSKELSHHTWQNKLGTKCFSKYRKKSSQNFCRRIFQKHDERLFQICCSSFSSKQFWDLFITALTFKCHAFALLFNRLEIKIFPLNVVSSILREELEISTSRKEAAIVSLTIIDGSWTNCK